MPGQNSKRKCYCLIEDHYHTKRSAPGKETGIDRNPVDEIDIQRPNDQRERYLGADEIIRLRSALDQKMFRRAGNGGGLYELAKILGHANIKMTERYAKLAKNHIARTGSTAREMWRMMDGDLGKQSLSTA